MYTLDANIFLRDVDQRAASHAICHTLLKHLHRTSVSLVEPFIVLAEVAGPLSRTYHNPMRGRVYADILLAFPHITFIPIDRALATTAAEIAADYALRGMDAIYVAVARQHGSILVTLDDEVHQRAGASITVQTPAEALDQLQNPPLPRL